MKIQAFCYAPLSEENRTAAELAPPAVVPPLRSETTTLSISKSDSTSVSNFEYLWNEIEEIEMKMEKIEFEVFDLNRWWWRHFRTVREGFNRNMYWRKYPFGFFFNQLLWPKHIILHLYPWFFLFFFILLKITYPLLD